MDEMCLLLLIDVATVSGYKCTSKFNFNQKPMRT